MKMEEQDIKQLWQEYDKKLEKSLALNYKIIREMQTDKATAKISSFQRNQVVVLVLGILWVIFLGFLMYYGRNNLYFFISIGIILLFNVFAVGAYIRHLALLDQINIAESVTQAQQKLSLIQASLNNVGRILILQAPLYCTFYYSDELVAHAGTTFWLIQFVVVTFFIVVSIYLYRTLTMKNIHRKWVRYIMESFGGKSLMKAMEFVREIEEYKMEKAN
ncbi:hypothetical protein TH53_18270 [Pedobacter lusitanus]|uniref:Uncharacterized protein n=1 Tax=Pedobacter lusitanus TaxID=1503925 RepID=A0A0D0GIC3_9SPHI|nr:hypothetical protein [Pedobacter lusitanus]KIO75840.1 hypothetical protein TH53_18270 [Pedobacter lusitanus]